MKTTWQLQEAKSRLSELIDEALRSGPQTITRRGKEAVVVVPAEEYRRMRKNAEPLSQFLRRAPLAGVDLSRQRDLPRDEVRF